MIKFVFGIVLALHGAVHLLYAGQSWRLFELQPGMIWPDGSWALSRIAGIEPGRLLATALLVVAAVVFIVAGGGLLLGQDWWRPVVRIATVFSSLTYLLLWDGGFQKVADKGGIGVLINLAILAATFLGLLSN